MVLLILHQKTYMDIYEGFARFWTLNHQITY